MRLKAEANWIGRASAEGDVGRNERSEWHRLFGKRVWWQERGWLK